MRATLLGGFALVTMCCSAHAFDCQKPTVPAVAVVCSDLDLIKARKERQQAWKEARARTTGELRRSLVAEQGRWLRGYPISCGVQSKGNPPVAIDKRLQECFRRAIEERTAYLRTYPVAPASPTPTPEKPNAPIVSAPTVSQGSERPSPAPELRSEWLPEVLSALVAALRPRPTLAAPEKGRGEIAIATPLSGVRLTGIVTEPYRRIAIFVEGGGRSLVLAEGDTVGGWRIETITPGEVSLSSAGGTTTLQPEHDPHLVTSPPALAAASGR